MYTLPIDASQADILKNLNSFKILALNYAVNTMANDNSIHLEPREVKSLVDIVLSLEDSIKIEDSEGKQVRTVQRLLARYSTGSDGDSIVHKSSGFVVSTPESTVSYNLDSLTEEE